MYTYDEVHAESLKYFGGDELATGVCINKYLLRDRDGNLMEKSPDEMIRRITKEFARIEANYPSGYNEEEIYKALEHFRYIVPQGSPLFGVGNNTQISSLSNCFVVDSPHDCYSSIIQTDENLVNILKRRGGCGIDLSNLRPGGSTVRNSAMTSDGVVCFMERYSNTTKEVAQSGRRGALMLSLDCRHPDVERIIQLKCDKTKCNGANISIRWHDDFIEAVQKDAEYILRFPVDAKPEEAKYTKTVKAREVWKKFVRANWESAEPGCLFWDRIVAQSLSDLYADKGFKTVSTNPCIAGETLVYVADGRGFVSIKDLAEKGEDIPVFCYDNAGKITIRKMRNPRITGYKTPVYKIKLDDGYEIRVTENHKFRMIDGSYKEAKNLKSGDSLKIITRYEASIKDIWKNANSNSQDYFWLNNGQRSSTPEHRIIASYFYNHNLQGKVVHHKDFDSQNNNYKNLRIMDKNDHDQYHGKKMRGKNNPMRRAHSEWSVEKWNNYRKNMSNSVKEENNGRSYSVTNEEIRKKAIELTQKIKRRFSEKTWFKFAKKNNLPMRFTAWRKKDLGSVQELSLWAYCYCGYKYENEDPRLQHSLQKMLDMGYQARIHEHRVLVTKKCEFCKNNFEVEHNRREISYCSVQCYSRSPMGIQNMMKGAENAQQHYIDHAKSIKKKQIEIFCALKNKLQRRPWRKEWENECKLNKIPFRLSAKNSFKNYTDMEYHAELHNHRVVSIEPDGFDDVYNGTVDEFHNFFVGGFESQTKNKKRKWICINNMQCGELPLSPWGSCILMVMNLASYVENPYTPRARFDFDKFGKMLGLASNLVDDLVDLELEKIMNVIKKVESDPESDNIKARELALWKDVMETCRKGRRVGLGVTALADTLASLNLKYDSTEALETVEKLFSFYHDKLMLNQARLAQERGMFSVYEHDREMNSHYIGILSPHTQEAIKKHGRRNISITTIAPAGSVSLLIGCSSGIEPVFELSYNRRRKIMPEELSRGVKPSSVDVDGTKWLDTAVVHPGLLKWRKANPGKKDEESPYWKCQASELKWINRVRLQAVIQKYITHSISSTLNLPSTVTEQEISDIYMEGWKMGCKGLTIYREGSREGIMTVEENRERPKILECDIQYSAIDEHQWIFFIGLKDGRPYEIFGGTRGKIEVPKKYKKGWMVRDGRNEDGLRMYDLHLGSLNESDDRIVVKDVASAFSNTAGSYTRMISLMLKTKVPIHEICEALNKDINASMFCFEKGVARVLKKYIKDGTKAGGKCEQCGSESFQYRDGCKYCSTCGFSKCS